MQDGLETIDKPGALPKDTEMDVVDSESARGARDMKNKALPIVRAANMATLGYSLEGQMHPISEENQEYEKHRRQNAVSALVLEKRALAHTLNPQM